MKKRLIMVIAIITTIVIVGCSNLTNPALQGFYQSTMKNGYHIQFSFESDEDTFVAYINNIEINKGTYEALGDGNYILKGDTEELEIKLEENDSFNLSMENLIEKLNEGEPIQVKNIDKTPTYFEQVFSEEYKEAIENLLK
ncbi:MAG: hypothetical protein ACRCXT_22005 [Paraclostridium sp.]